MKVHLSQGQQNMMTAGGHRGTPPKRTGDGDLGDRVRAGFLPHSDPILIRSFCSVGWFCTAWTLPDRGKREVLPLTDTSWKIQARYSGRPDGGAQ